LSYQSAQYGFWIFIPVIIASWIVAAILAAFEQWIGAGIAGIAPLLGFALFGVLRVSVGDGQFVARFGWLGLFRRRIDLGEVRQARAVRNKWYYGWGIRLTPHGWLWNIQGLDAVELELNSGRKTRIGTDQPKELVRAVDRAIGAREPR